ncbi:hypothetical protein [Pedobacter caeni]|uniref:Uncharacterized protein n=1 Tax=Pedobacter caeni TaxID=288992 RepID=A0A1M5KXB5_9SPHI|nr:hypothetical protein [Pedobacter caeni]SHG57149.1 hypothetical protein SAMN04488522_106120 [Pedobacter caeni]
MLFQLKTSFLAEKEYRKARYSVKRKQLFYGAVTAKLTKISGKYLAGNMIISDKFSSTVPVSDVVLRFQRPSVDAGGCKAEGIRAKVIQTNSFYITTLGGSISSYVVH